MIKLKLSTIFFFNLVLLGTTHSTKKTNQKAFLKNLRANNTLKERKTKLTLKDLRDWSCKTISNVCDEKTNQFIDLYKIKLYFKPEADLEEALSFLPIFLKKALVFSDTEKPRLSFFIEKKDSNLIEILFSLKSGTNIFLEKTSEKTLILKTYPKIYSDETCHISST